VAIIGLETLGSNCFYSSISLNSDWQDSKGVPEDIDITKDEAHGVKIAHLEKLPSRATSLGASWASPGVIRKALGRKGGLKCVCISDTMSMNTAVLFAGMPPVLLLLEPLPRKNTEEHKILVELACSTTLAPAYEPSLMSLLLPSDGAPKTVVIVVCGGFKISLAEMDEYRDIVRKELEDGEEFWKGTYNGEEWSIKKKQNMDG
jgi:L-serine/L-threonine ammonia-lyase